MMNFPRESEYLGVVSNEVIIRVSVGIATIGIIIFLI